MKQYVIIGNGIAAAGCIEGIRSVDGSTGITVISEENHPVYCRPLISYYLERKTDIQKMNYRSPDFYEKNGCSVMYGKKAADIDAENRTVTVEDGAKLPYTALCVATGSSPFIPPFEGLDTVDRKFSFMSLDDATALEAAVTGQSKVLIVGAGLIGLKCAEGLRNLVARITVCDLAERVLSSILDADCAVTVQRHLEKNGITFILGDSVARFDRNKALMKSGRSVDFDLLVLAVGVRANTSLLEAAGGQTNRGICVDESLKTSLDGIYAAGDCAEGYDASLGQKRVLALLPNAYMQGYTSGVNMAGGSRIFNTAIPMNSIGFFGLHIMTAGCYEGRLYEDKDASGLKRLFVSDGVLKGFIIIGQTQRAGIYTALIREKTPLDTVDFDMLRQFATTAAFSGENRRKKFGGLV